MQQHGHYLPWRSGSKGNELTEGVKGRIWTKDIEKEELANYKQTYKSFLLI
jgi:hypothetical protein